MYTRARQCCNMTPVHDSDQHNGDVNYNIFLIIMNVDVVTNIYKYSRVNVDVCLEPTRYYTATLFIFLKWSAAKL